MTQERFCGVISSLLCKAEGPSGVPLSFLACNPTHAQTKSSYARTDDPGTEQLGGNHSFSKDNRALSGAYANPFTCDTFLAILLMLKQTRLMKSTMLYPPTIEKPNSHCHALTITF